MIATITYIQRTVCHSYTNQVVPVNEFDVENLARYTTTTVQQLKKSLGVNTT